MKQPLILLFGMPRSGTTWLGKIFDSHPDTLYRHEPDGRGTLDAIPLFPVKRDAEKHTPLLKRYIEGLPAIRDEKVSATLPIFPKRYYNRAQLALRVPLVYYIKIKSRILGTAPLPKILSATNTTDATVVWKSIESLGRLGLVAKAFPEARCLLILRHPCGYIASVLRGESTRKFESATASDEDWEMYHLLLELAIAKELGITFDTITGMTPIERLALRWALYYEHALTETAGLNNVLVVRYKDFCAQPLLAAQKAFQHCRLSWTVDTERFITNSTSKQSNAYYSVFKDPKVAAERWKKELSKEDISSIMAIVSKFSAGSYYTPAKSSSLMPSNPRTSKPE